MISILGSKLDCFPDFAAAYDSALSSIRNSQNPEYITVNNVHTIIEGFKNKKYQRIINQSYLSIPDGKPLEIVGRIKGNKTIKRLFGPTLMEKFIEWGQEDELSHFFFGSSEATLMALQQQINLRFPKAKIAGVLSPPYMPVDEWDNAYFIEQLNNAKADIVWIGLGAPKQEKWMFENYKKLDKGLLIGIGAGFDYIAGNTKHAPDWMKNYALEWLYRLSQEPKRLWKRYITTIPLFIFLGSVEIIREKLLLPSSSKKA